jgi:Family of unknown function (DUF6312)
MEKLVNRVTVIERGAGGPHAMTVYKSPKKGRSNVSILTRPLERVVHRLVKAEIIFAQDLLRRHEASNRKRRDGWLLEAPVNIIESGRKAYNEARKAVPFRLLSKA